MEELSAHHKIHEKKKLVKKFLTFVKKLSMLSTKSSNSTFTKNPPANIKVITVTEARVVAFFISKSVAPIAKPRPWYTIS
jgi:hypothetical protein